MKPPTEAMTDHDEDEDDTEPCCDRCCNLGVIDCLCGGDFCVCHNYGEMPCPKCDY